MTVSLFDIVDDISYERLYNTIETLLPKAIRTDIDDLKLVEMYAFDNSDMLEKASREPDG